MNNENTNPMIDKANQDLMGGQNGSITPNAMQGVGEVKASTPVPGVVSIPSAPPTANTEVQQPVMPGMNHSGINANTMAMPGEVETPSANPANDVNSAPGATVNPFLSKVEMTDEPKVMPMEAPKVSDSAISMPEIPSANPEPIVNENVSSVMMGNSVDSVVNPTPNSVMMPEEPKVDNVSSVMAGPVMGNNVNNNNMNNIGMNSGLDNTQNVFTGSSNTVSNTEINNAISDNNVSGEMGNGGSPMTSNIGMSQVGQTDAFNNPAPASNQSFVQPQRKFPLSTREIILVSIAIVGLVIVAIMYL